MTTWVFQVNPDQFEIDSFLASGLRELNWRVSRYRDELQIGDQVFIWRAGQYAGVIADARITELPVELPDDESAREYWTDPAAGSSPEWRTKLRIIGTANKRQFLKRDWLKSDPIVSRMSILVAPLGTNFRVTPDEAERLNALWINTGNDWTRNESLAGLWAYNETIGGSISKSSDSPVGKVALLTGRAITGVYNKVMNFRAIDPSDKRAGLDGAGSIDRAVWKEFYDEDLGAIRSLELETEFNRVWGGLTFPAAFETATAEAVNFDAETSKLATLPLKVLLARIANRQAKSRAAVNQNRPPSRRIATRIFDRDPAIVAAAKVFSGMKCEIPNCPHPTFYEKDDQLYSEVHHIEPLSEGGSDTLDNIICLCPAHHREAHFGTNHSELKNAFLEIRRQNPISL